MRARFGSAATGIGEQPLAVKRGRLLPVGAAQAVGGIALGFGEQRDGVGYLVGAAAVWGASLVFYGGKVFRD